MDHREMAFEDVNWIEPAQIRIHFCMPSVITVADLRFLKKERQREQGIQ